MRALFETLFDIVYLVTVITLGIRMIRGSKGNRQFQLFGWMAVVLGAGDAFHLVPRALALCTTGPHVAMRAPGPGQVDHLDYHDRLLCAALLRLARTLSG